MSAVATALAPVGATAFAPEPEAAIDNLLLPSRKILISLPSWPGPSGECRDAEVTVAQSFTRSEGTGAACWDSSVALAAFLIGRFGAPGTPAAKQVCADPWLVAGSTVLELGAGCAALPSVACSCELGAALVLATDAGSTCLLAAHNLAAPGFQEPLGESAKCLGKIMVAPLIWTEAGGAWGQEHAAGNDGDNCTALSAQLAVGTRSLARVYVGGRVVAAPAMARSSKAASTLAQAKLARSRRLGTEVCPAASGAASAAIASGCLLAKAEVASLARALAQSPGGTEREALPSGAEAAGPVNIMLACNACSEVKAPMRLELASTLAAYAGAQEPQPPSLAVVQDAAHRAAVIVASDVFHDHRAYAAFWATAVRHLSPGGVCIAGEPLLQTLAGQVAGSRPCQSEVEAPPRKPSHSPAGRCLAAFRRRLPEAENTMFSDLAPDLGLHLVCAISADAMLMSCRDSSIAFEPVVGGEGTQSDPPEGPLPDSLLAPPFGCHNLAAVAPEAALLRRGVVNMLSAVADPSRIWVVCFRLEVPPAPKQGQQQAALSAAKDH